MTDSNLPLWHDDLFACYPAMIERLQTLVKDGTVKIRCTKLVLALFILSKNIILGAYRACQWVKCWLRWANV